VFGREEGEMRFAVSLTLALVSAIVLLYAGMWWGSREKTCAVVPSAAGNVVLCSNSWAGKVGQ
jgi:hypothetical protein